MKILVIADIDDLHWKHDSGQADLLLSCGDVVDQVILEAAEAHNCQDIFAVKGKHDRNMPFEKPIIDIHLQTHNYNGLSFCGLNGSWKYKPRGYFLYDQCEVQSFLSGFPSVDIFLSHNSPRGVHDKEDETHYGFDGLNFYLTRAKLKLLIHGHQHIDRETFVGKTKVVGVYGYKIIEV